MAGSEGTPATSAASSLVPNQLAALVPTYDPSKDDLEIYTQKIELLTTTWPPDKFGELATRLILGCQGTAFLKLQQQKDQVTLNDKKSIQRIVEILGGQWGQIPLERKYEAAERALFRCQQRSDESNDSFLARADVLWQDLLKKDMKIEELQAYVTLRGSNLGPEDKKRVILECDSSDGKLSMKKVSTAVRMLGAGFFHEMTSGKRSAKLKVYDQAVLMAEEDEEGLFHVADDDGGAEDELVDNLASEGDDDALLVTEFEAAAVELVQEDSELAAAFNSYTEARKRLSEKFKHRGFFPTSAGRGKGRFGKSGKGKGFKSGTTYRKSLQIRILNSTCRLCGRKGHWKAECPSRNDSSAASSITAASNSGGNASFTGTAVSSVPEGLSLEFLNLQEFGKSSIDEDCLHDEFVFFNFGEPRKGLREVLNRRARFRNEPLFPSHVFPTRTIDESNDVRDRHDEVNCVGDRRGILSNSEVACSATDYSADAKGVLDSGATKTVIGSKLVESLLHSLSSEVRKRVTRSKCKVTFRFGNLSTLEAHHALVIPIGSLNLRVAIVPGSTPFLISNTLMRALRSVVDTHEQKLHSPFFTRPISLELTNRGLFLLDINELVIASTDHEARPTKQDTFVAEEVQNSDSQRSSIRYQERVVNQISRNHTSVGQSSCMSGGIHRVQEVRSDFTHPAGENSSCGKSAIEDQGVQSNRSPSSVNLRCDYHGKFGAAIEEAPCRSPHRGRGSESILIDSTTRDEDRFRDDSQGSHVSGSLEGIPRMGEVVSGALWAKQEKESSTCGSLLLSGDRTLRVDRPSDSSYGWTHNPSEGPTGSSEAQSQGSQSAIDDITGGVSVDQRAARGVRDGPGGVDCHAGEPVHRSGPIESTYDSNGGHAEPDCAALAGCTTGGQGAVDAIDIGWHQLHAGDHDIDELGTVLSVEGSSDDKQHFDKLVKKYTRELPQCQGAPRKKKHVLFEVFCGNQSQLTQQCRNIRGDAQRFCRERGDLQTVPGRLDLFTEMHQCQPEHIWFSPSCNPWCGFSNLNGSRSLQAWDELQAKRHDHLEQIALGVVILRFQITNQRHLHWEQPKSSVMFKLPLLRELSVNTKAAEFDMCQFGLRDPNTQKPIKKRMIVMTTSNKVFKGIHGRICRNHEQHQVIEGSVTLPQGRCPRSQYTERYPRKFARSIIMLLDSNSDVVFANETEQNREDPNSSGRLVKRSRLSHMYRAKGELSRVSEPSQQLPPKRRRLAGKHEVNTIAQEWQQIIDVCNRILPRVGFRVIEDADILRRIQDLIEDKQVCFIVAGRGSERTMPPCKEIVNGEAPYRKSVLVHRVSGKVLIEDEWEKWEGLAKRQLIRSSHPCRIRITLFARNPDAETPSPSRDLTDSGPTGVTNDDRSVMETQDVNPLHDQGVTGPIQQADLLVGKHGPKFQALPKSSQQIILKAHVNLGHPSSERLQELFKQQGYDENMIAGISELACSTCQMQSRPRASRPGVIHVPLDFNDKIAIDGLKFTNQQGQVFHILHVIDLSTNFHTAVIAPNRSSEATIQALIQSWLSWAGAPQELIMDSASELNSDSFRSFLQQYNIRGITTAPEAHWQNGRAERHGAIIESMLKKLDCEFPIGSYSQLQRCLWHVMQAKNACSLRRGFSPEILVFGKSTRVPASLCGDDQLPAHCLADEEHAQGVAFREHLLIRENARKAFHQADNDAALRRAVLRRNRPSRKQYTPGEWIMMWRNHLNQPQWIGPMQTIVQDGQNTVWASMCGKLFRGAPENIRPVSAYEATKISVTEQINSQEISSLSQQVMSQALGRTTEDVETRDADAQVPTVSPEILPASAQTELIPPTNSQEVTSGESTSSQPDMEPEAEQVSAEGPTSDGLQGYQVPVPESSDEELLCQGFISQDIDPICFVQEDMTNVAWRIEINIGTDDIEAWRNETKPEDMLFLATAAKRQRSEVKLCNLDTKEREEFNLAKKSEIMNWLKTDTVCKMLRNQLSPEEILRCRWVLTWKPIEEKDRDPKNPKDRKAKARLVVLGYLDPSIEKLNRDSPTLSKHARMLLLQLIASNGWNLQSFDIKAAFLQGKTQKDRIIGIEPVPELTEALKLKPNEICRLTKSAYGLIDAPFLWYQTLKEHLVYLGFEVSPFDPCLYVLRDEQFRPHGVIGIHVDDGLCGGDEVFQSKLKLLQEKYPFGSQKLGEFVFTGIHLQQRSDKGIIMSQSEYVRNIGPIKIESNRKSQIQEKINEEERQQLRALIGSLQYAAVNTRPDLASRLSYLQSRVNSATVETLLEANKILHEGKRHHDVSVIVQPIACNDLRLLAFSDASFSSKSNPDSHSGSIIMSTHKDISKNLSCCVSPLSWGCKKIQKVVTSTLAAETMSLSSTLDQLSWLKIFWAWLLDSRVKWDKPEEALQKLPGAISSVTHKIQEIDESIAATDCKSLYDLVTRTAPPNCSEFRTQLQARAIKNLMSEGIKLRWVHSGAQLADALTKIMEASFLRETLQRGRYKLHDELEILKQRSHNRTRLKWLRSSDHDSPEEICNFTSSEFEDFIDFLGV